MTTTFTRAQFEYLSGQRLGGLATIAPDGTPHNKLVSFHYNAEVGTIDIYGFNMDISKKFRNVQKKPKIALGATMLFRKARRDALHGDPRHGPSPVRRCDTNGQPE